MIAIPEGPDWEERFWKLTRDLVVRAVPPKPDAMLDSRSVVADCLVVASVTIATYKAVLERYPEQTP